MTFKNIWTILFLAAIATNIATAASEDPRTPDVNSLKALSCIADCSKIILETNFDPARNKVVAGDQALMTLNLLAVLPGDNPLRSQLAGRRMEVDPKAFADYNKYISHSGLINGYSAIFLPKVISPDTVPPILKAFGADIQLVLDDAKAAENADRINSKINTLTKGIITGLVNTEDMVGKILYAISVNCFKSLWDIPFEEEEEGWFETVTDRKRIRYLHGIMTVGYKDDFSGEVIVIPLKNGAKFVIYKPKPRKSLFQYFFKSNSVKFFDHSMLKGLKDREIDLRIPKLNITSNIDLKMSLIKAGYTGLEKRVWDNELQIASFFQKTILKTTLRGVEAIAVTNLSADGEIEEVIVNSPHSVAIIVPLPDGKTYIPLFNGYIGDPTLS